MRISEGSIANYQGNNSHVTNVRLTLERPGDGIAVSEAVKASSTAGPGMVQAAKMYENISQDDLPKVVGTWVSTEAIQGMKETYADTSAAVERRALAAIYLQDLEVLEAAEVEVLLPMFAAATSRVDS